MKKRLALLSVCCLMMNLVSYSQISFYASTNSGCTPLPVNFSNTSLAGVHFDWYFGDGTNIYDTYNVSHTYTTAGTYTVYMYAYDAVWNPLGQYQVTIEVNGQPDGIYFDDLICPLDEGSFGSNVTAPFYTWNFGDGTTINTTNQYINHAYNSAGIYNVSMSYYDQVCGTNYTVSDVVTVTGALPYFDGYAGIYIYETTVCPGATVHASANYGYQSYVWDFDNGTFGSGTNTEVVYSSIGLYDIALTMTNGCGVDTTVYQQVNINNSIPAPSIPIMGPTEVCVGEEFSLNANGPQDLTYSWNMGDGSPILSGNESYKYHTYATAGTYTVTLTIQNLCGNTTTQNYVVQATTTAPVYDAQFQVYPNTVCPGDAINYYLPWTYDYYIDFGDGTGATDGGSHTYTTTGVYELYAIVQNACGSTATLYDTVYVQNNLPITDNVYMDAYPDPACPNSDVEFYAVNGFSSYAWNFGDGFTGALSEINHPYANPGTYTYSVTITNGCGADTTIFNTVSIQPNLPLDDLDWTVYASSACPGTTVYMSVDDDGDDLDVSWDFGDGSDPSSDMFTSHVYDTPGNYTVTLVATNGCGSDSTVTHAISINNSVTPESNPDLQVAAQTPGCVGDNLYFIAIPAGIGTISWDFGDGDTGFSDQLIISEGQPIAAGFHAYSAPGTYTATATITNACGNSYDTDVIVEVSGPGSGIPAEVFFWHDETEISCEGQAVTFYSVGCGTYVWDFGDGTGSLITYSSLSPVEHVYDNDGNYNVTVNGFNACGSSDVADQPIVIPDSEIDVTTNTVQDSDCGVNNGVAIVTATGGSQPYTYSWTSGDDGVLADSLGSGIYMVTVTDNNGCSTEAIAGVSDDQGPVIILENIVDNECFGQNNGVISVSILGGAPPYIISWSNGDVTQDIFGLESGPYEIFVTDANGCFAAESFTVGGPEESILSIYTQPATCNAFNGTATAAVSNGTAPFTYMWPNLTGANSTSGLAPGVHELLVIDGNACLIQKDFVVNEVNGAVIVTDSITDATCSGDLSAVYISTIGGTAPFTYEWSNSTSSQDLTNVLPGEYSVEVTGADGCSGYMFFNVEMSAPAETNICMVTVDTLTNSNIVVWVPSSSPDAVSYNIYKESSESGLYFLVANQSADDLSEYYDYASNPAIKAWRYKVSALDDCGNESELSDPHKTIHLSSNLGVGGVVNLIWDHYNGFSYDTYYIHRYHPSTGWMVLDSVSALNISYTDLTPPSDSNLVYIIEVVPPSMCTAVKVQDHNSSRSNKSSINMPNGGGPLSIPAIDYQQLSIYPNPTSGMVQMMYSNVISELKIYDLSGQLVYRATNASNVINVDCGAFAGGVYTVQLTTENGTLYSKLVKQ